MTEYTDATAEELRELLTEAQADARRWHGEPDSRASKEFTAAHDRIDELQRELDYREGIVKIPLGFLAQQSKRAYFDQVEVGEDDRGQVIHLGTTGEVGRVTLIRANLEATIGRPMPAGKMTSAVIESDDLVITFG